MIGRATLPGVSEISFTSHSLMAVRDHSTPHAFPNVDERPAIRAARHSLPRSQQLFNYAALTPAMAPVDREYLYGSLDRKILRSIFGAFWRFQVRARVSGTAPGRRLHLRRMYSRMQLIHLE